MRWISALFLGLTTLSAASALTVDEAVKQARAHNLGLAVEDLKVAQKADEKTFSFNRLYPTVSTSATVLRLNNLNMSQYAGLWDGIFGTLHAVDSSIPAVSSSTFTSRLGEDNQWNASLGVNVQFLWSPAVFRGIAQTMVDYENAALGRAAAEAKLDRDVRKAFAQLLALHQATQLFESQLKVAEDRYKLAKLNADAGLGSEIAALQAQVAYENRKPSLAEQKLNEANALNAFRMLLNLPDGAPLELEGSLDVPEADRQAVLALDVEALVKTRSEVRYDVQTARGTAKSLDNLAALQSDTLLPSMILGWSADPTVNAPFHNDNWKDAANWKQSSGNFMVGLGWKLDGLLPGSTTGLQIAGFQRQAQQARLGADQAARAGAVEIRSLVGKAQKSAGSLESLTLALALAQRSSKLNESGYQTGNQSFNDVQDADLQLQAARLQLLNEQLAFGSALADLDYALAQSRADWLTGGVRG